MKKPIYLLDEQNEILSAYDKETDFFAQYRSDVGKWQLSKLSFVQFRHDYNYKQIDQAAAAKITNGVLADTLFAQFVDIIEANKGARK